MTLYHKHLLINAKIDKPFTSAYQGIDFLKELVNKIDMKIIQGPYASYVNKIGNRGLTAVVMIETSHIAFHIWDEKNPALIQFDLYTCSTLPVDRVLKNLEDTFGLHNYQSMVLERSKGFKVIDRDNWNVVS